MKDKKCSTKFELIDDDVEGDAFYGRCVKDTKGNPHTIQIAEIEDTSVTYGDDEPRFLVELTEFDIKDVDLKSFNSKYVLNDGGILPDYYKKMDMLNRALEQKRIGLGVDVPLGEPYQGSKKYLAKVFESQDKADQFVKTLPLKKFHKK